MVRNTFNAVHQLLMTYGTKHIQCCSSIINDIWYETHSMLFVTAQFCYSLFVAKSSRSSHPHPHWTTPTLTTPQMTIPTLNHIHIEHTPNDHTHTDHTHTDYTQYHHVHTHTHHIDTDHTFTSKMTTPLPLEGPSTSQWCQDFRSTAWVHQGKCRYNWLHHCVPPTAGLVADCVGPRPLWCHHCSNWSISAEVVWCHSCKDYITCDNT